MIKIAIIRKEKGKYKLYSKRKGKNGKRRLLGTSTSLKGIKQREKEIQYFKHHADDQEADDKETKMLKDLSNIAGYLEEAGMIDASDKVYAVMECIDSSLAEDYLWDGADIPDAQSNPENMGYAGGDGTGGGYSMWNAPYGQPADDLDDHTLEEIDKLPKKMPLSKRDKQKEEALARSNGLSGNSPVDNQFSGMFQGLSDAYFYRGSGSLENNI